MRRFGGAGDDDRPDLASGTDRVAEAARRFRTWRSWSTCKATSPRLHRRGHRPRDRLLERTRRPSWPRSRRRSATREQLDDPACVKVVFDAAGRALYFSRSPIPLVRDWDDEAAVGRSADVSISTSACTPTAGSSCCGWPKCRRRRWKQSEKLEQLRVLEAGRHDSGRRRSTSRRSASTRRRITRAFVARCNAKPQNQA